VDIQFCMLFVKLTDTIKTKNVYKRIM